MWHSNNNNNGNWKNILHGKCTYYIKVIQPLANFCELCHTTTETTTETDYIMNLIKNYTENEAILNNHQIGSNFKKCVRCI